MCGRRTLVGQAVHGDMQGVCSSRLEPCAETEWGVCSAIVLSSRVSKLSMRPATEVRRPRVCRAGPARSCNALVVA